MSFHFNGTRLATIGTIDFVDDSYDDQFPVSIDIEILY